jgi:hypothetical protein
MPRQTVTVLLALLVSLHPGMTASAEKDKQPTPIGWIYLETGAHDLAAKPGRYKGKPEHLAPGTLAPVFKITDKDGVKWAQVRILNMATMRPQVGWVESDQVAVLPPDSYPLDTDLLAKVGEPYVDDFTAEHTNVARFLVRQGQGAPLLLCYIFARPLPTAKLVAFTASQGRFLPSASLDFPISEIHAGIISLEIRDLLGDANECLITREPFREGPETHGLNLIVRRIEGDKFRIVWQAPVEFHNLSEFKSKVQILQPPEKNIGAPGTTTTGDVTFRQRGNQQEPVWKGKVEFFLFGREKAVDSVTVEKVCPWDGKEFAPLR